MYITLLVYVCGTYIHSGFILKAKRESGWLMHFKKTIHIDPTFFEAFESKYSYVTYLRVI